MSRGIYFGSFMDRHFVEPPSWFFHGPEHFSWITLARKFLDILFVDSGFNGVRASGHHYHRFVESTDLPRKQRADAAEET